MEIACNFARADPAKAGEASGKPGSASESAMVQPAGSRGRRRKAPWYNQREAGVGVGKRHGTAGGKPEPWAETAVNKMDTGGKKQFFYPTRLPAQTLFEACGAFFKALNGELADEQRA